jgi:hypothetical protein
MAVRLNRPTARIRCGREGLVMAQNIAVRPQGKDDSIPHTYLEC